eukprot:3343100-Rhodomonas_salina.1
MLLSSCNLAGSYRLSLQSGLHVTGSAVSLTLKDTVVTENFNGGIFFDVHQGLLSLMRCSIIRNYQEHGNGGGVRVLSGSVNLHDTRFEGNQASLSGGGLSFEASSYDISIRNCTFYQNIATSDGAGMYVSGTSINLVVVSSLLQFNRAQGSAIGGAAFISVTTALFSDTRILGNSANLAGGGMALEQASGLVHFQGCSFEENESPEGGGCHIRGGTISLYECNFRRNSAVSGGGGVFFDGGGLGSIKVEACRMENNTAASGNGGGIKILEGDVNISASQFRGNVAGNQGGGLCVLNAGGEDGTWLITQNEFSLNSALKGGALCIADVYSQTRDSQNATGIPLALSEDGLVAKRIYVSDEAGESVESILSFTASSVLDEEVITSSALRTTDAVLAVSTDEKTVLAWRMDPSSNTFTELVALVEGESEAAVSIPVAQFDPVDGITMFEAIGTRARPVSGWGVSHATSTSKIGIGIGSSLVVYDQENRTFSSMYCSTSSTGAGIVTALTFSQDGADLYVSMFSRKAVGGVPVSYLFKIDVEAGVCVQPYSEEISSFTVVRAMYASQDGLYLFVADQVGSTGTDGVQNIKSVVLQDGTAYSMLTNAGLELSFVHVVALSVEMNTNRLVVLSREVADTQLKIDFVTAPLVTVRDCDISQNEAAVAGGGIMIINVPTMSGTVMLDNLRVSNNIAQMNGGALQLTMVASMLSYLSSRMEHNQVRSGQGGAISAQYSSSVSIGSSHINSNVGNQGSAIFFTSILRDDPNCQPEYVNPDYVAPDLGRSHMSVFHCWIENNVASEGAVDVGAVYVVGSAA